MKLKEDVVIKTPLHSSYIKDLVVNGVRYKIDRIRKFTFTFETDCGPKLDIEYACTPLEEMKEEIAGLEVSQVIVDEFDSDLFKERDKIVKDFKIQESKLSNGEFNYKIDIRSNNIEMPKQFEDHDDYINNIKPMFVKKDK